MKQPSLLSLAPWTLVTFAILACSAGAGNSGGGSGDGDRGDGDVGDGDGDISVGDGDGDISVGDGDLNGGMVVDDPTNCADAAASESYIGCDFWPTITANPVWVEFDFAVVVANPQDFDVDVTITGPGPFSVTRTVPGGALETFLLPWVDELKGPEYKATNPAATSEGRLKTSLSMEKGAYHMVSDAPIAAWQFNPLQYRKAKADCGARIQAIMSAESTECRAASNDAALLLPSTAMTGTYRVGGYSGAAGSDAWGSAPGAIAITATKDSTTVQIQLPPNCEAIYTDTSNGCVVAGGVVPNAVKDEVLTFTMQQGDVIQIMGAYGPYPQIPHADLSGSLINADQPIQVIAFNQIVNIPDEVGNADHVEETVLPAEVIGNKYIVAPPSAFGGTPQGHIVRLYGNVDGTNLTYPEGKPAGAPDVINAGEVVEVPTRAANNQCPALNGTCMLNEAFVVEGDQPFAVGSFLVGGRLQVPGYAETYGEPGDPAYSMMVTPEQFRQNYTFLAPADFMENYADVLVPDGAEVTLDGAPLGGTPEPIGSSGWSVVRVQLSGEGGGIHTLSTTHEAGVGLQVMGFGSATSYYYPGGLNLKKISIPPTVVVK